MNQTDTPNTLDTLVPEYLEKKNSLGFFDVNLWWDPSLKACLNPQSSFDAFYKSLDGTGIRKAVLTLAECVKYNETAGNAHLKEILAKHSNLFGAMTLTSDFLITGEDITKTVDEMVEARAVIVRMFPRTHRHPINKGPLGELFRHLSRRRIPLMLWHAEASWDAIASLLSEFPEMPLIVEGNDVKLLYHNRHYVPMYQKYPNLYLETHNMIIYKELDLLANMDPTRLLFGSYHQYNTPDTAMAPVILADMDEGAKSLIAHSNLERLVDGIRS